MRSRGVGSAKQELQASHVASVAVLACLLALLAGRAISSDYEPHVTDAVVVTLVVLLVWVVRRSERRLSTAHGELEHRVAQRTNELAEAQQTYQALFDFCPVALQIFDVQSLQYVAVNDAATKLTGYSRDLLIGMSVLQTAAEVGPEAGDAIRDFSDDWSGPAKLRHADGSVRDVEVYTRPIKFRGRDCWLVATLDTSARYALERQLSQAQRMDAVGRLACGVAHEFNDMLSVLLGYAALLLQDCSPSDPMFAPLSEMQRAGERASDVSRRLLTFSRLQPTVPQSVDVNDAVRSTQTLLVGTVAPCELVVRLSSQDCVTTADASQLEQIIINLVSNARDAMPNGGAIRVETGVTHEPITASGDGQRRVVLTVRDSGPGIPVEIRARVFEPFFTTKPQGRGTGLGLSIVYGIVEQCGGVISLDTPLEGGTEVTISLPAVEAGELRRDTRPSMPERGPTSVLLVAAENAVSTAAHNALLQGGYRVLVAREPGQAAILLEEHLPDIEVLLTESTVGDFSGTELARRLQIASPKLKTLYLPEHAEGGVVWSSERQLETPITPRALSRRLRAILATNGAVERHASQ